MDDTTIATSIANTATSAVLDTEANTDVLLDDELLVEEISIDGMCGVY